MDPDWSNSGRRQSRRAVLQTGIATLATGAVGAVAGRTGDVLAGVRGRGRGQGNEYPVEQRIRYVPAGADAVAYFNAADLLADPAGQAILDAEFAGAGQSAGPGSLGEALDGLDAATSVSIVDDLEEVVQAFWITGVDEGVAHASVLWTEWTRTDVVESMESFLSIGLEQRSYRGYPFYVPSDDLDDRPATELVGTLGVLGDGTYVIGSRIAVATVLSRVSGRRRPLGRRFRRQFRLLPDGPAQMAVDVPQLLLRRTAARTDDRTLSLLMRIGASIEDARAAMSIEGDERHFTGAFDARSRSSARTVATLIRLLTAEDGSPLLASIPTIPIDVDIDRQGSTTTAETTLSAAEVESVAAEVAGQVSAQRLSNPLASLLQAADLAGIDLFDT